MATITPDILQRFIEKDEQAVRDVVGMLTPIFQRRIRRVLLCRGVARKQDMREEMLDMIQNVWAALLKRRCHLIRMWDPTKGSFENFAGLIAEQTAAATFRSRRDSLFKDAEAEAECMNRCIDSSRTPERLAYTREALRMILCKLRAELTERGLLFFELLIVQQRSVEDVCQVTGMNESAIYAWKSRLGRRIEEIAREILP